MPRRVRRVPRGFSLIELIITLVLVAIIGAAAGRMLMSQTRFYTRLKGQRDARSVTRNARNLMQTELSMTVAGAGGVVAASNDSVTVNMPYGWGVFCSSSTAILLPVDSSMYAMASIAGYAIKDTTSLGPYTYTPTTSNPSSGSASDCTGLSPSLTAPTNGRYIQLSPTATATPGSPLFLYQKVTYKFGGSLLVPGKRGLFRKVGNAVAEEILAPFDTSAKFRFYNMYADTAQTAVPALANIRGLELKLDAQSKSRASNRATPEAVSIKTAIFFRNRID